MGNAGTFAGRLAVLGGHYHNGTGDYDIDYTWKRSYNFVMIRQAVAGRLGDQRPEPVARRACPAVLARVLHPGGDPLHREPKGSLLGVGTMGLTQ